LTYELPNQSAKMSQETRRGIVLHEQNPFIPSVKTRPRKVTNKRGDMMLVSASTGEIHAPIAGFWESKEVDSTRFIKLFVNGVKAIAELSNAGTKVFELLYIEMEKNVGKDQVYLSYSGIDKNDKEMSERTFRRGLSELIEKKFIAGMPAVSWYWVNPDFMWNGDRIAFVQQYYRQDSERKTKEIG
jgi:hypothetical protein